MVSFSCAQSSTSLRLQVDLDGEESVVAQTSSRARNAQIMSTKYEALPGLSYVSINCPCCHHDFHLAAQNFSYNPNQQQP